MVLASEPGPRRAEFVDAIRAAVPEDGPGRILMLSFLAAVGEKPEYVAALHETMLRRGFTLQQRYFFYWQLIMRLAHISGPGVPDQAHVYADLLRAYRKAVNMQQPWIAPAARDPQSVVVITNQLLALQHAPTADCLDYCRVLQRELGMKVLLVNTASMPWAVTLPYFDPIRFNYVEAYSTIGRVSIAGEGIEFYQCREPMPNLKETRAILATVQQRKPAMVLSLGHSNIAADLCSDIVTVATMPFGTNLPRARSNLFILPRRRRPDDESDMRRWEIEPEQIVESEYTFKLPERTATLSRAALGLPEDAFVIVVVGNRLDEEVTDDVARELARMLAANPGAFVAFAGTFRGAARLTGIDPVFAVRSRFLGYQQDMLAVYEVCDAYLNPPRYGGGSSAAFALAMGLPVLTLNSGDVANIVGTRFIFPSFDGMREFIGTLIGDGATRTEWSAAARRRFAEISDREGMLRGILRDAGERANVRARP
jgi:hypothetical protein